MRVLGYGEWLKYEEGCLREMLFAFLIYNLQNGLLYHIEETKKLFKSTVGLAVEVFKRLRMEFHSFIPLKV